MSVQGLKCEGSFLIGFRCRAGSLGTTERILSFQGLAALVTMWFLDPPAKLWVQLWLSFSSLSCNKKVRPLAFVLGLLGCFHLQQDFHMIIPDKSGFFPAVLQNLLPCFDEQPHGDSAVLVRSTCVLFLHPDDVTCFLFHVLCFLQLLNWCEPCVSSQSMKAHWFMQSLSWLFGVFGSPQKFLKSW